jgi:cyclohexanone monooxygenase
MGDARNLDAVVVGAGFSGLYMLRRLRDDLGLSVRGIEAADDVGGTWWWNRYPGARSDSDSTVYNFSDRFDEELLDEWRWSERYPSQPEILRYLELVADRYDLRGLIDFSTRVTSARFDDTDQRWNVTTDTGMAFSAAYLILAVGALSKPNIPDFPGIESFQGQWFHTARMPHEGVDYRGKRVAVIGNGATAVQIVPVVAHEAEHVFELSRNPYHCLPGRNHELDEDDWREIRAHHKEIWERARGNIMGFPYADFEGLSTDFSDERREEILERLWRKGGFPLVFAFGDVLANRDASDVYLDFLGRKIRSRVRDPEVAARLTPTDPFASKRPPIEHGYYQAFNRDNVSLIDIKRNPIAEITASGVRTADGAEHEVDIILLATGFDGFTGSILDMDIRGREGRALAAKWADGPTNYLGLTVEGFPNLFMHYCGPYNPAILCNALTLIEQQGEWILGCIAHLRETGLRSIEPRADAEREFVRLHSEISAATTVPDTQSWWTGTNIEGKSRALLSWVGGFPEYQRVCDEAVRDYAGFTLVGEESS